MANIHWSGLFDNNFDFAETKYHVLRDSLTETCIDPQVLEVDTQEGIRLYIRFKDGELTCKEKWNGYLVCSGYPFLEKGQTKLKFDRIEFYLEMYSKHIINFV